MLAVSDGSHDDENYANNKYGSAHRCSSTCAALPATRRQPAGAQARAMVSFAWRILKAATSCHAAPTKPARRLASRRAHVHSAAACSGKPIHPLHARPAGSEDTCHTQDRVQRAASNAVLQGNELEPATSNKAPVCLCKLDRHLYAYNRRRLHSCQHSTAREFKCDRLSTRTYILIPYVASTSSTASHQSTPSHAVLHAHGRSAAGITTSNTQTHRTYDNCCVCALRA